MQATKTRRGSGVARQIIVLVYADGSGSGITLRAGGITASCMSQLSKGGSLVRVGPTIALF